MKSQRQEIHAGIGQKTITEEHNIPVWDERHKKWHQASENFPVGFLVRWVQI